MCIKFARRLSVSVCFPVTIGGYQTGIDWKWGKSCGNTIAAGICVVENGCRISPRRVHQRSRKAAVKIRRRRGGHGRLLFTNLDAESAFELRRVTITLRQALSRHMAFGRRNRSTLRLQPLSQARGYRDQRFPASISRAGHAGVGGGSGRRRNTAPVTIRRRSRKRSSSNGRRPGRRCPTG